MITINKTTDKGQQITVTMVAGKSLATVTIDGAEYPTPAGHARMSCGKWSLGFFNGQNLVLTAEEAAAHNDALTAHQAAIDLGLAAATVQTKTRAELELDVYNTATDAFPGSAAWLKHDAAEKALALYDLAHPAEVATVTAERAAAAKDSQEAASAKDQEITVGAYRAMMAAPAVKPALYTVRSLPRCWVGADAAGALHIFDAVADGWTRTRRAYKGHRQALVEAPLYNAMYTGYAGR